MKKTKKNWLIINEKELEVIGKEILPFLKTNTIIFLSGALGSGKTTFSKVIARLLGIKKEILSPTFSIVNQYLIKKKIFLNHYDFFRLDSKKENFLKDFEEFLFGNINIVEWPEKNPKIKEWLDKKEYTLIFIKIVIKTKKKRQISLTMN